MPLFILTSEAVLLRHLLHTSVQVIHVLQGGEHESLSCTHIGFLNDAACLNWNFCSILVEKKKVGGEGKGSFGFSGC